MSISLKSNYAITSELNSSEYYFFVLMVPPEKPYENDFNSLKALIYRKLRKNGV